MSKGAALTTLEYAEAMEEILSGANQEINDLEEDFFSGTLFSSDEVERMDSLETAESWSEEDAEFASKGAETVLRAFTSFYDDIWGIVKDSFDEMSDLRPPEHLSDLHSNYIASYGEFVRFRQTQAEIMKDADTDIRSQEDFANIGATITFFKDYGLADPDLEEEHKALADQADEACRELAEQLKSELERYFNICVCQSADARA